jgi:hypothetical protein
VRRWHAGLLGIIALSAITMHGVATDVAASAGAPALAVDVAADRHPISPDIYGMNDNPYDPALAREIRLPVSRWGGDAATRYNWQVDASNAGDDWFFMAGSEQQHPTPSGSADRFVRKAKDAGGKALLTDAGAKVDGPGDFGWAAWDSLPPAMPRRRRSGSSRRARSGTPATWRRTGSASTSARSG